MESYTNEQKVRMEEEEFNKQVDNLDSNSLPPANIMVI